MSFTPSHGTPLYYQSHGKGPAILFSHGAGSNAATWWQQIPTFSQRFQCLTHDHRCFARSEAPPTEFKPEYLADDLLAVIDAAQVEKAALVCQSLGGIAGLRLALRHPERVSALVLCDSPLAIDDPELLGDIARFLQQVETAELENRALSPGFVERSPELAFLYGQINLFNRAVYQPDPSQGWGKRLARFFDAEHLLPTDALRELRVPTLFVVGAQDPVVTPRVVRRLSTLVPGAQVLEVPDAGHSPYFEQSRLFNQAVQAFLETALR